jgi:hypothetical protein
MLVETIAWIPRTLKTALGRKRYDLKKIQGLDYKRTWLPWAYLQETRDLNLIMYNKKRSNM